MKRFILRLYAYNKRELFLSLFVVTFLFLFVPIFTLVYFSSDLTTKDRIMNKNNTGLTLLDKNGQPFFTFYRVGYRDAIPLLEVPKDFQNAIVASEDKDFYRHMGFSPKAIIRSIYLDLKAGSPSYGGSTVTQQLVKNALLSSNKSFLRKYQEIVLAAQIEYKYTKPQILEMYVNSVYFGQGAFGVEAAARRYFGKHAKDLTLAESAMLVGVLPEPSRLSPLGGDEKQAKIRQGMVLDSMVDQKFISQEQKEKALRQTLVYKPHDDTVNHIGTHFALYVRDLLEKEYSEEEIARSGFTIRTTLDVSLQTYAENTVRDQVAKLLPNNAKNGAAVVLDAKSGAVRVMVGSKDWYDTGFGKVNMAVVPRQPGSSFKPIVYAKAFEDKLITPATVLKDELTFFPGNYRPKNYDGKFRGPVLVRRALANSLNVPSVSVMQKVGVENALEMAHRMGITTLEDPTQYGLSLVLGAGEVRLLDMAGAYSTFANEGVRFDPYFIDDITDKQEKTIFHHRVMPHDTLDKNIAFLITSILSDNQARVEVFGNTLTVEGVTAAVKTGTTEDYRDAWTLGYIPGWVVGVWVGNNDNKPMDNVAGSLGAAPIWKQLIKKVSEEAPYEAFSVPETIAKAYICKGNGLVLKQSSFSGYLEYFLPGTTPQQPCVFAESAPLKKPLKQENPSLPQRVFINPPVATEKIEGPQKSQEDGEKRNRGRRGKHED